VRLFFFCSAYLPELCTPWGDSMPRYWIRFRCQNVCRLREADTSWYLLGLCRHIFRFRRFTPTQHVELLTSARWIIRCGEYISDVKVSTHEGMTAQWQHMQRQFHLTNPTYLYIQQILNSGRRACVTLLSTLYPFTSDVRQSDLAVLWRSGRQLDGMESWDGSAFHAAWCRDCLVLLTSTWWR
jgi:hypothetical protein